MNVVYDNIFARIENPPESVQAMIMDELRYHPDGYEHVFSYKSHKWDGYNYLYNKREDKFRVGLLARVEKLLQSCNIPVVKHYVGTPSPHVKHRLKSGVIRPYDFQQK